MEKILKNSPNVFKFNYKHTNQFDPTEFADRTFFKSVGIQKPSNSKIRNYFIYRHYNRCCNNSLFWNKKKCVVFSIAKKNYHNLKINENCHTLTFVNSFIFIFFREIIQLKRMIYVIYSWNKLLALSLSLNHLIL